MKFVKDCIDILGFIIYGRNSIWAWFERGSQDKIKEHLQMEQYVRVKIKINEESETQSMATNVFRFMNYRITPRAAFYGPAVNDLRNWQTMNVPEANQTRDERFRNFVNSNYGRSRAVTARTEFDSDNIITMHVIDVIMNSNISNTYEMQPDTSVAMYKMVRDSTSVRETRMLVLESTRLKNTQNLIFYICVVLML